MYTTIECPIKVWRAMLAYANIPLNGPTQHIRLASQFASSTQTSTATTGTMEQEDLDEHLCNT